MVTVFTLVGCAVTTHCPIVVEQTMDLPSGNYAPAVAHRKASTSGAPFFTSTFPRGAVDATLSVSTVVTDQTPAYDASEYPGPGEAISSAMLHVDRGAGTVLRSYVDVDGHLREERWRIQNYLIQDEP